MKGKFPKKLSWLFKSYSYGDALFSVPAEEQKMSTPSVFRNKYLVSDRQHALVAADLYSAETQYGIALLEPRNTDFFDELELVTYQLSAAVRTLNILKKQSDLLDELHLKNLALEELSHIDELTGANNRRGFYMEAEKLVKSGAGKSFTVCYADMDGLKTVNDTYGHDEGDFCIKLVAQCMHRIFGDKAVIGRMGGDEFAAIMISEAAIRPWDILAARDTFVKEFNSRKNKPYLFNISLGVHDTLIKNVYDLQSAINIADSLLYIEKKEKKRREGKL